jgi:chromosome segregation ATPase
VERLLSAHLTPDRTVAPTEQEVLQQLVAKDDEERLLLSVLRRGQVRLAAFEQEMAHLNQERDQLQRQLHALRSQQKTVGALEEYYQRIRDRLQRWEAQLPGIEQTDARELKRELMADLVDRIVVEDTETVVYYRFTAQQEVVALLPMSWRN